MSGIGFQPVEFVWKNDRLEAYPTKRSQPLCEKCKSTTTAALPETLCTTTAGPKLLATTAIFLGRLRGSRRLTAEALESIFGIPASASWIVKLQTEITSLLRPIYDELVVTLPRLL